MSKPLISVTIFFSDDQYDVEVNEWNADKNRRGLEREDLSDYGFSSKEEVQSYINKLKKDYAIAEIKETSEEEVAKIDYSNEIKEMLTPNLATYAFYEHDLKEFLEELFYKKNSFEVKLEVIFDSEYMYISPSLENSDKIRRMLFEMYQGHFDTELLKDLFDTSHVEYSVLMDDSGIVHIHVPFKEVIR
jgi:hypothetical protein